MVQWPSWLRQRLVTPKIAGSNPVWTASPFKSRTDRHQSGELAEWLRRWAANPEYIGSIPILPSKENVVIVRDITMEDVSEITVELHAEGDSVSVVTPHGLVIIYLENGFTMINENLHY